MCRSIKVLRTETPVTADEISAAALQFVRKVSGTRKPSRANQEAFDAAVRDVAAVTQHLLQTLPPAQPRRTAAGSKLGKNAVSSPIEGSQEQTR